MKNLFENVQTIVDSGNSAIMDMDTKLKAMGHADAKYQSGAGVRYVSVTYNGKPYVVVSKNAVEIDAETKIIGPYAVGMM